MDTTASMQRLAVASEVADNLSDTGDPWARAAQLTGLDETALRESFNVMAWAYGGNPGVFIAMFLTGWIAARMADGDEFMEAA